jgi:flavin reductase (DIM6/NTAB) family NADH-FMN oxidoreductase RutF
MPHAAEPAMPPAHEPDATHFREAMSHLASGVVLVTACIDGRPWGMTVSAACPVCVDPPTMLVSLASRTALAKAVAETGRYGVNILGTDALGLARFGSAVGAAKFLDEGAGIDLGGRHPAELMVDGALGHVDCEVVDVVTHGTHSLFLGRVRTVGLGESAPPLVHYRREFWRVGEAA